MAAIANINSTLFAMNTSLLKCQMFSKIKDKLHKLLTFHPLCNGVTSVFLEGVAEGAIAVEPTLLGQCHSCDCTRRITVLKIQPHEVFDTQAVDIGIISNTLLGEMATEIGQRSSTRLHGYKRSAFRQDSTIQDSRQRP